jgi:hypothetical protein
MNRHDCRQNYLPDVGMESYQIFVRRNVAHDLQLGGERHELGYVRLVLDHLHRDQQSLKEAVNFKENV